MNAVVSLHPNPECSPAAAELVRAVSGRLAVDPETGADGSWEFRFDTSYAHAHAAVVDALASVRPDWPAALTVDYVLTV
jgi:hypothetical protein